MPSASATFFHVFILRLLRGVSAFPPLRADSEGLTQRSLRGRFEAVSVCFPARLGASQLAMDETHDQLFRVGADPHELDADAGGKAPAGWNDAGDPRRGFDDEIARRFEMNVDEIADGRERHFVARDEHSALGEID